MVVAHRMSMKGARVDGTAMAIGGQKFREGSVKIIGDKGGDHIFFTIRNDKEVAGAGGHEVVLLAWARKYT